MRIAAALLLVLISCSNGRGCYSHYDAVNLGLLYNAPLCMR